MKNRKIILISSAVGLVLLSSFAAFYPSGAPVAVTGSPGDGANCSKCHGGTASSATGWITSNIPSGGYIPGQTYQITATNSQTGSGKYGFEVSPQNQAGNQLGTFAAATNCQMMGSGKYITQTNASTAVRVWTFPWTAPAAGNGNVTFYGAFARGYTAGATVLSTLVVPEQKNTGISEIPAPVSLISDNAGNGEFTVTIPESMRNSNGTLQIMDASGKSVYSAKYSPEDKNNNIKVSISNSPGGVYFMVLQNASANKTEKFILK